MVSLFVKNEKNHKLWRIPVCSCPPSDIFNVYLATCKHAAPSEQKLVVESLREGKFHFPFF